MYAREGIDLPRSTMVGWAAQCAILLEPLAEEIKKYIFTSSQIHADDTTIKVLAPGAGKTKTGRLWTYVVDGKPHGDKSPRAACYYYSPDRKGIRPEEHLKDYKGVVHADAYGGYNNLYIDDKNVSTEIKEAGCWAHTRRKFYEVTVSNANAKIAIEAVEKIREIYEIESMIRGLAPEERLRVRQEKSKVLVEGLFKWFSKVLDDLSRKGSTAKAINYAMNNKKALMEFLENGKIEIDNNAAERAMRSIAIGRKNWMFAGSDAGGKTASMIYTIIETAKLNDINPWSYLKKVLDVIQDHKANRLSELLPWTLKLD